MPRDPGVPAIRRLTRWIAVILGAVVLAVTLGTLVPRPASRVAVEGEGREILVLMNPIHTDIAIPLDAGTGERFGFAAGDGVPLAHPEARYLVVGWGGRAFYLETPTWADVKPVPLIKGVTLDSSVLHLDVIGDVPDGPLEGVLRLRVGEEGMGRLLAYVERSFSRDGAGRAILVPGRSYGFGDRFYEAEGWFNALLGCNAWTSGALAAAGIRTGLWTPLPQLLALSIRLHN